MSGSLGLVRFARENDLVVPRLQDEVEFVILALLDLECSRHTPMVVGVGEWVNSQKFSVGISRDYSVQSAGWDQTAVF